LKSTHYDGLCGIFEKKIRAIQVARQTIKFFKKKNARALSKQEMRHRLAPNFASSFS